MLAFWPKIERLGRVQEHAWGGQSYPWACVVQFGEQKQWDIVLQAFPLCSSSKPKQYGYKISGLFINLNICEQVTAVDV